MMGLAPHGKPVYKDIILDQILILKENGSYYFNTKLCDYHGALYGNFNKKLIKYLIQINLLTLRSRSNSFISCSGNLNVKFLKNGWESNWSHVQRFAGSLSKHFYWEYVIRY